MNWLSYYKTLSPRLGCPAKDAHIVIGAVIIKHKLSVLNEETVEQIRENLYPQYFIGLKEFQPQASFTSSLLIDVCKRMKQTVFDEFHETIIGTIEHRRAKKVVKTDDNNKVSAALNRSKVDCSDNAAMITTAQSLAEKSPYKDG